MAREAREAREGREGGKGGVVGSHGEGKRRCLSVICVDGKHPGAIWN